MNVSEIEQLVREYTGPMKETGFTRLEFTLFCGTEEYMCLVQVYERDRRLGIGSDGYLELVWTEPGIRVIIRPQPTPTVTLSIEEYINANLHMGL